MDFIISKLAILPGIIIGLTVHEYAHARVAYAMGDSTAKNQGRVSLNPLAHLDVLGILCLILVGFGWGKPVPVNSRNLSGRNRRLKEVAISSAGVIANFILAIISAVLMTVLVFKVPGFAYSFFHTMLYSCLSINVMLMIFNLLPLPPLDGFNIVAEISGFDETEMYYKLLQYGSIILLILVFTNVISYILTPGINAVMNIIQGIVNMVARFIL